MPESPFLTTGAAGAGGGFLRLDTLCVPPPAQVLPCTAAAGDQEDISIAATLTDVQCAGPITPPYAPFCPGGVGGDYTGPVIFRVGLRLTDHASGPAPGPPAPPAPPPPAPCAAGAGAPPCTTATVTDFNFDVPAACGAVAGPVGSTCPPGAVFMTTVDTLVPGTVIEFQRMSFRTTDEVQVLDPGPDGMIGPAPCPPTCGTGDEGVYRAAGQFAP